MTLEAKARVREHVRRINSSASNSAAPVVRPNPAPQFQVPPSAQPPEHANYENPLEGDSQVKNGLDYS
jgi:acetolactate synthase-1/2/3 large subunit